MSIVLSQKSGKTLVFIREIMEKSGNLFSENGSDPWKASFESKLLVWFFDQNGFD